MRQIPRQFNLPCTLIHSKQYLPSSKHQSFVIYSQSLSGSFWLFLFDISFWEIKLFSQMAAVTARVVGGNASSASWMRFRGNERKHTKTNRSRVSCSYSSSVMDSYKTLRIQRGASESEVRKAFRQLALQVSISTLNFPFACLWHVFYFIPIDSFDFWFSCFDLWLSITVLYCVWCSTIQMCAEGAIAGCNFTKSTRLTM